MVIAYPGKMTMSTTMSCFLLPSHHPHLLKLALLPRFYIQQHLGYQNYPPVHPPPPPRFLRQPTPGLTGSLNGSFRTPHPGLHRPPGQNGVRSPRPGFQLGVRALTAGFQRSPGRGSFFKHGGSGKGVKRKAEDKLGDNESECRSEGSGCSDLLQPLYCKICKVNLNAPSQAKQHYEGKNHAKKMKLYMESQAKVESTSSPPPSELSSSGQNSPSDTNSTTSSSQPSTDNKQEQPSSTTNGSQTTTEINPEIYCKICGVSFNSPKQAHQHYQGKNHAKRLRASNAAANPVSTETSTSAKQGSKYICFVCNINVTSQEQLESHLRGSKHIQKVKIQEKASGTLKGRWAHSKNNGGTKGLNHNSQQGSHSDLGLQPPPVKKPKRDFSMYRTPSGKYYCSCCNLTLNSDIQFAQHIDSKKHKANNAARRSSDTLES